MFMINIWANFSWSVIIIVLRWTRWLMFKAELRISVWLAEERRQMSVNEQEIGGFKRLHFLTRQIDNEVKTDRLILSHPKSELAVRLN